MKKSYFSGLATKPNMAVERDGLQAALAGSLRASRSGRPSPLLLDING